MKKILYILIVSLICYNASGQFVNVQGIGSKSTLYKSYGGLASDSGIIILNSFPDTTTANSSVISKYNSFIRVGTNLYFRTLVPLKWNLLLSGSSSGFIATSDTASMLVPYLRKTDTASLVSNRLKISDTATMLQRGWLANRSKDSIAVLRAFINSKGGGSVISVATNSGTGILGGTIISTGTLRLDTLNVSTRLWRQKGIDSTVGLIVQKVNIIDTAPMLNTYLRKVDTASLSNRINLKVNISDTASMLSNRLKISDTLTMLSPYARTSNLPSNSGKLNISDTASMLSPYRRTSTAILQSEVTGLTTSLGAKINVSDSAAMLTNYLRKTDTSTMLSPYVRTSNLPSIAGKLNISDTLAMLNGRINSITLNNTGILHTTPLNFTNVGGVWAGTQNLATQSAYKVFGTSNATATPNWYSLDTTYISNFFTKVRSLFTAGTNISIANGVISSSGGGGSGTVTSVATNNGSGITGGTITTSGTISADTSVLSTKANVTALLLGKLNLSAISGTTNYLSKYSTASTLGNSQIFDNGTIVVIGGTSGSSLFNVIGQQGITNPTTYSSGTAAALGVTATTTYTGTLTSSNASFSSIVNNHASIFNGNTTVNGNTPFGSSLPSSIISFSNTGTVTMSNATSGIKGIAALSAGSFDDGSVNGTVTRTAGIQINGIFKITGATATITRTNHYQLLISDINEFSAGGNVTNRYGIYQVGSADSNYFAGNVKLPNLGSTTGTTMVVDGNGNVFKLTSSKKYKENIVDLDSNKINSIYSLKGKNYNYIKDNVTTAGIIAEDVDSLGLKDLVVYKDGKPDGLNYQAFTPYIIELLKAQKIEIEMLKKEIITLKNKK